MVDIQVQYGYIRYRRLDGKWSQWVQLDYVTNKYMRKCYPSVIHIW